MAAHQQEAQALAVSKDLEAQPLDEPTSHFTASGTQSSGSSETHRELNHSPRNENIDPEKAASDEEKTDLVDWDGPDDERNPMNWTSLHKWIIISLVSAITFNVFVADTPYFAVPLADGINTSAMASTIFAPGVPDAMRDFHSTDSALSSLLVSIYVVGLAIGPLLLSPLSELYGRAPVMHTANFVFLVATILCAVSVDLAMLIVFRLIMGLACCIPLTLGGGFVADLMIPEERGTALSLWTIGPLLV